MHLYRIISEEEWLQTIHDKKVPRCNSDKKEDCVHLTNYEDLEQVASKYFVKEEKPVVLKIDSKSFEEKISWGDPTNEKPWHQPNANIDHIDWNYIIGYSYLIPLNGKENEFSIGAFLNREL